MLGGRVAGDEYPLSGIDLMLLDVNEQVKP